MIDQVSSRPKVPTPERLMEVYPQLRELHAAHLDDVAAAFVALSPEYFLSRLGVRYLARNFWRVFAEGPENFGFVWLDDGKVVGFVGGTEQRDRFIPSVIRRSPLGFVSRLAWAGLRSPTFVTQGFGLFATLRQERARGGPAAEIVSLGVLPHARRPVDGEAASVSPAQVLLAASAARLRNRGVQEFRLYTGAANRLACQLYRRLGFTESHRLTLFGELKVCFIARVDAPALEL